MFVRFLKTFTLFLIFIGVILLLALNRPAIAAPPDGLKAAAIPQVAQSESISLEKQASSEIVPLGEVVTYTISIKNDGAETINPTLTDALPKPRLPQGLTLQTNSITATKGLIEARDNTIFWSGSLAQGEEVVISYMAIPPLSTGSADQTLTNVAVLEFGQTTLEARATVTTQTPNSGIWRSFVNFIAVALVFFDTTLEAANIPYAFGFAIILFTVIVRGLTFPLNMQQIKSSKAMQELQPKMKALQEKHKNDKEKLAQEQMKMYKEAGVNPLGGCLPMLVQMPVWFALYQALIQLSSEGLLTQGFLWIPRLDGPVTDFNQGIGWLWPLPPSIGWPDALAYLVLPVLLVVSQLYMQQMMTPPSSDPQQAQMQSIMKFMPLMFGYFALVVPSGLSLYWFTSNLLGLAQHYFTKTHMDPAPASAGAAINAPVPATPTSNSVPATSGENEKNKDVKRKRKKSRRKR